MSTKSELRNSIRCAYANGGVWGLGSGLASTTLVFYFATELKASGLAKSWLLAAPPLAGLLRLFTPLWMHRVGSRRRFSVAMFLASSAALAALPMLAAPGFFTDARHSILALGVTWTGYQVLEFIGVVALWSWYGDLIPPRIRGRFVGRREAWMIAGLVVGALVAAIVTWQWQRHCKDIGEPQSVWRSYAACASFGAALLALAALPLNSIADLPPPATPTTTVQSHLGTLLRPFADRRFRRLLVFGTWYSIANGLVQTPRQSYLTSVLKLQLASKRALDGVSRGAQVLCMPRVGAFVDRRGNVPMLAVCWGVISLASIFFLAATPVCPWWIIGAYICWIAYAGLNVAFPNLMLGLSRPGETAAYAAAWFAWTQLAYAVSLLLGGALFDQLKARFEPWSIVGWRLDHYAVIFLASGLMMAAGVVPALRIPEPEPKSEPFGSEMQSDRH